MLNSSQLYYIANHFEKLAEEMKNEELSYENEYLLNSLSWLIEKPSKNIEGDFLYWLNQNKSIFDELKIKDFLTFYENHSDHTLTTIDSSSMPFKHIMLSSHIKIRNSIKYEILNEYFLKGYASIPNIYAFKYIDSGLEREPLSKKNAHLHFIEVALKNLHKYNYIDDSEGEVESFMEDNYNKLNSVASGFSYPPKLIGDGSDGVVFDVGPNQVLKIFQDSYSFNKAKEAVERLHKNPNLGKNEAMIYDIGELGEFRKKPIYYYVIEKMKMLENNVKTNLSDIIRLIGNYVRSHEKELEVLRNNIYDPKQEINVKQAIDVACESLSENIKSKYSETIKNIESTEELKNDWVKSLCEEVLFKYVTGRGDLHMGNIGKTNYGNFVYFDPSHSNWTEGINTPYDW